MAHGLAPQRATSRLRLAIDDMEQRARRASRSAVATLPVPQRARADREFGGEFELRKSRFFADGLYVDIGDTVNATCKVRDINSQKGRVTFDCLCKVGDIVVIEGEAMAYNAKTGKYYPFQETTKRRRVHNIDAM